MSWWQWVVVILAVWLLIGVVIGLIMVNLGKLLPHDHP